MSFFLEFIKIKDLKIKKVQQKRLCLHKLHSAFPKWLNKTYTFRGPVPHDLPHTMIISMNWPHDFQHAHQGISKALMSDIFLMINTIISSIIKSKGFYGTTQTPPLFMLTELWEHQSGYSYSELKASWRLCSLPHSSVFSSMSFSYCCDNSVIFALRWHYQLPGWLHKGLTCIYPAPFSLLTRAAGMQQVGKWAKSGSIK